MLEAVHYRAEGGVKGTEGQRRYLEEKGRRRGKVRGD